MIAVLAAVSPVAANQTVDHSAWDGLLRRVVSGGLVDYAGLKQERGILERYLKQLGGADPAQLGSREEQLAFWINAYNVCVFTGVLERYPLQSVKQIKGFFDGIRYQVAGQARTLNEIEAAGRALGDWRIHFAVVCASSSCPPLRSEAYVPDRLDAQLTEQTRNFLRDAQRGLRVDPSTRATASGRGPLLGVVPSERSESRDDEVGPRALPVGTHGATLWVSKIFDWYATDFVPASELGALRRPTAEKLMQVLSPYLSPETLPAAQGRKLGLKFFTYDWSLNERKKRD